MKPYLGLLLLGGVLVLQAQDQPLADPKDKIKIARDAGKAGSPAMGQLEPLLLDPDPAVRLEAVKAVIQIGGLRSLDLLANSCKDGDGEIQIRAVDGIINFYIPGYVQRGLSATLKRSGDLITAAFKGDEEATVIAPDITVKPDVTEAILGVLKSGNSALARANAARALGILRARPAVQPLIEALRSKDDRLIYESLIAMQKIGEPTAGPRCVFLVRDLEPKVQLSAIETVGLLRTREAVPDLNRVLEGGYDKKAKRAALLSLARIGDPSSRRAFEAYLIDKDDDMRASAAEGIGRIAGEGDAEKLQPLFDEEKKFAPRLAMAFALVAAGRTEISEFSALQYLSNALTLKTWRGVAQPYLSELAYKPDVRANLYVILESPATRKEEKTGIAGALAGCRAQDAVAPLEKLARDQDPEVGTEALRALRILRASVK